MASQAIKFQIKFQNKIEDLKENLRDEEGEIGSQLILMAILVGAALLALEPIRSAISGLVGKITGGIDTADVG